jgi:hypothetical protein
MLTNPFCRLFRTQNCKSAEICQHVAASAILILLEHLFAWHNFSKEKLEKGTDRWSTGEVSLKQSEHFVSIAKSSNCDLLTVDDHSSHKEVISTFPLDVAVVWSAVDMLLSRSFNLAQNTSRVIGTKSVYSFCSLCQGWNCPQMPKAGSTKRDLANISTRVDRTLHCCPRNGTPSSHY